MLSTLSFNSFLTSLTSGNFKAVGVIGAGTVDFSKVITFLAGILTTLKTVGWTCAGIGVVCLCIGIFFGGSQGMAKMKNWGIGIVVGSLLLALGATLLESFKNLG